MSNLYCKYKSLINKEGFVPATKKCMKFVTKHFRYLLEKKYLYKNDWYNSLIIKYNSKWYRYRHRADPYKIIFISAADIQFVTGRGPYPGRYKWQDSGLIQGGDWDLNNIKVETIPVVKCLINRFKHNKMWEETEFYQNQLEIIQQGGVAWRGVQTKQDLVSLTEYYDEVYYNIRENGYMTKKELIQKGIENKTSPWSEYKEIAVDISRSGEFLFVDGRHRLAIAKSLGIERLPVRVVARHSQWQKIRDKVISNKRKNNKNNEIKEKYLNHPDIKSEI